MFHGPLVVRKITATRPPPFDKKAGWGTVRNAEPLGHSALRICLLKAQVVTTADTAACTSDRLSCGQEPIWGNAKAKAHTAGFVTALGSEHDPQCNLICGTAASFLLKINSSGTSTKLRKPTLTNNSAATTSFWERHRHWRSALLYPTSSLASQTFSRLTGQAKWGSFCKANNHWKIWLTNFSWKKKKRHFVKPSVQEQPKMSMQHVFHSFIFYNCALVCLLWLGVTYQNSRWNVNVYLLFFKVMVPTKYWSKHLTVFCKE